ncbi:unnamed protein product [Schistosoma curassoni]|nr:unnamed protein product [Schistosoma curassoni]
MLKMYQNLIYYMIISYLCVMICSENLIVTFVGHIKNAECYEKFFQDDIFIKINEWKPFLCKNVTQLTYTSLRLRLPKAKVCGATFHQGFFYSSIVSFSAKVKVKLHRNLQVNIPFMKKQLKINLEEKSVTSPNNRTLSKHYEKCERGEFI